MAILKQISTGRIVAGGLTNQDSAKKMAKNAGVAEGDYQLVFSEKEVLDYRREGYAQACDHLFIDYMANLTELGDAAQATIDAKQAWLGARASVKASFPKS
ncbi:hypothetical protein N480_20330 [Pseudoalteromonas luteoviolacea S2607]|uniref:hypothetical protein n=1 Tax=Pseudoalteromonas luteoviolacea TaxID=43657 RepID=UPI0007B05365|nr:hypothetical protein [Pseudoalteromonas luteoviolacea]KZN34937.1 hypothetical protein N480_20330 [Pseudoalteromonas luteoviolacea S2607]